MFFWSPSMVFCFYSREARYSCSKSYLFLEYYQLEFLMVVAKLVNY